MSINLTVSFAHPSAIAHRVRYARIDNVATPVFVTVTPNPTSSPATIATDIPNGQYAIEMTPIYSDLRNCPPDYRYNGGCQPLLAFSASLSGNNIIVSYQAPSGVPKVRITVNYPNGGSTIANYVNNGFNIAIPIPTGVNGDFVVSGQSVCDEESGFYSAPSGSVTVTRLAVNTSIVNNATESNVTAINGAGGFALPAPIVSGDKADGVHAAFGGVISVDLFKDTTSAQQAFLYVNGTFVQCRNFPTTAGAVSASFSTRAYAATDIIYILIKDGAC